MKRRQAQSLISTLLLFLSVILLVAVAVLYIRDRGGDDEPVAPTAIPGHNQAIDVLNAIRDKDLDAEFGAQGSDVRSDMLERPGQTIELPTGTVYVFIYPDVATQEEATLDVLAEEVDLRDVRGDAIDVGNGNLFTGSNVAVLLIATDQETVEKVKAAVAALT